MLHISAANGLVGILELLIDPSYDIDFSLQKGHQNASLPLRAF